MEKRVSNKMFLSIVQGSFRQSVPKGTEGSVQRDWEVGSKSGVKHEKVFEAIVGRIVGVKFYEGESEGRKFTNLNVVLDKNEHSDKFPVISVPINGRYAGDIMKKLPRIDFKEEVRIRPFSFQPEGEDKNITGVELTQQDGTGKFVKKIKNFFFDEEKKESINEFPVPEGDTKKYDSDDWSIFYKQATKFLMNYTKANICTKFADEDTKQSDEEEKDKVDYPEEESIRAEDIPFN